MTDNQHTNNSGLVAVKGVSNPAIGRWYRDQAIKRNNERILASEVKGIVTLDLPQPKRSEGYYKHKYGKATRRIL